MTPLETADVLAAIASLDLRTIGEADIIAWHAVIGDLDKTLALEAVVVHHKTNTDRIKPAHLIGIAKQIRRDRAERENADAEARAAFEDHRDQRLGIGGNKALGGLPIPTIGQPVWPAYEVNDAINRPCPHCRAQANDACVDPSNSRPTRMPCLARLTGKTDLTDTPESRR
ncbi:hypothetical protein AB0H76_15145 [Nocardia sp. NPDC050712]|uniref:hypothetical protein n=1 Tax=Nocardia sp. NPDC050712 TaxID=3155518 RepID=UPI0033E0D851